MKKTITTILIGIIFGCSGFPTKSFASKKMYGKSLSMISSNKKLQEALLIMGYESPEEAAQAFADAEEKAKAAGLDTNYGTLALCGNLKLGAIASGSAGICSTLFHAYQLKIIGVGATMMAAVTASAIYFRPQVETKSRTYCFYGAKLGAGDILAIQVGGGSEFNCQQTRYFNAQGFRKPPFTDRKGFFGALDIGLGIGVDISDSEIEVTQLTSYWD